MKTTYEMKLEILIEKLLIVVPIKEEEEKVFVTNLGPPELVISKIDNLGNLEVEFTQEMLSNFNLTEFDESVMEIEVKRPELVGSDPSSKEF